MPLSFSFSTKWTYGTSMTKPYFHISTKDLTDSFPRGPGGSSSCHAHLRALLDTLILEMHYQYIVSFSGKKRLCYNSCIGSTHYMP